MRKTLNYLANLVDHTKVYVEQLLLMFNITLSIWVADPVHHHFLHNKNLEE